MVMRGVVFRYGVMLRSVLPAVEHELTVIEELNFASYFLTVHDIVSFAKTRGILCQGRGSAANSAVCYMLGITEVDTVRSSHLFALLFVLFFFYCFVHLVSLFDAHCVSLCDAHCDAHSDANSDDKCEANCDEN